MEKAHSRINWENFPSIATPLNAKNLNKMDDALNEVDNRVLGLDTAKLDKSTANKMVKDVSFNESTGIFTITLLDGTKNTIDTKLEKISTNFSFNYESQKLVLTLIDGTEQEVDLSSLISQFEFTNSDTISLTVDSSGKVSASVIDGSITENKLQPNFLADVKVEVAKADSFATSAYDNAVISTESAQEAKQYRDEAEQFKDEAKAVSGIEIATTEKAGIVKPDGTTLTVGTDGLLSVDFETVQQAESGKGLSTNDYTDEDAEKLAGVENNANNYSLPVANADTLGGIKTDNTTISVDENGVASVNVLDTYEEIMANTTTNKVAGSVGVKKCFEKLKDNIVIKNYTSLPEVEIVAGGSGRIEIDIPDASEYISNGYTGYILSAFLFTSLVVSNPFSLNVSSGGKIAISYKSSGTATTSTPRATIMWYKNN